MNKFKITRAGLCILTSIATVGVANGQSSQPNHPDANRGLALRILQDARMDKVVGMGRELLKSGLNAGSSYQEVWIRDLNTFIVPLLEVVPREPVREALLTFFHFQGEDGNIIDGYQKMRENVRLAGAATIGLTLFPTYPEGSFKNKSMGPYSYQNGGDWDWFGARTVRQLAGAGMVDEAYRELGPMLDRVIKHQGFFEWWTPGNEPKGSGKFRGAAGVLIEAITELRQWAEHQEGGKAE